MSDGPYKNDQQFPAPFISDIRWIWAGPGVVKLVFVERTEYMKEDKTADTLTATRGAFAMAWTTLLMFRDYINKEEEKWKTLQEMEKQTQNQMAAQSGSKLN